MTVTMDDTGWLAPGSLFTDGELEQLVEPTPEEVDAEGARRLVGTVQVLAGLATLDLLQHADGPAGLLGVLFPTAQGDERDRLQFLAGAIVGAGVASRKSARHGGWTPEDLAAAQQALHEIGYEAMARPVADAAAVFGWELPPPGHLLDPETLGDVPEPEPAGLG